MIIYRIFLLSFLSLSWLFLSGFDDSTADVSTSIDKTQKDTIPTLPPDSKINVNAHKVNEKKRVLKKEKQVTIEIRKTFQHDEFVKPLDLSIPLISLEPADIKKNDEDQLNEFFDTQSKKRQRSLELKGNFLMSPEPEVERRKTLDGAGISINVKPE